MIKSSLHRAIADVLLAIGISLPIISATIWLHSLYIGWWYLIIVLFVPIALSTLAQPKPFFITGMALSQNLLLWLVLWQTIVSHEPAVLLHIIGMLGWSIGWLIGLLRQKLYRSHRSAFWNGLGMPLLGVFLLLLLIGLGV